MARQKKEDPPKPGAPGWMATFSDLMNLLLCFFVLLFAFSSVDADKFDMVVASLQAQFSVLSGGGSSIGEGNLISSGVSQLEYLDYYYKDGNSRTSEQGGGDPDQTGDETETQTETEVDIEKAFEKQGLAESEQMKEQIEKQVEAYGLQNDVELEFNAQYVLLNLNGAILFDSGQSEILSEALPLIEKIGKILEVYTHNIIDVEGHTDNIPIGTAKYEDNNVLSMYRARSVADFIRSNTTLNPANIKSSGRGDYVPIADNSTAEGRARNRRVEIKIYNSYNSVTAE